MVGRAVSKSGRRSLARSERRLCNETDEIIFSEGGNRIDHETYASANVRMLLLILVPCTLSPTPVEDPLTVSVSSSVAFSASSL
jgi:hypothetical protein